MELSTIGYSLWIIGGLFTVFQLAALWMLSGMPKAIARRMKEDVQTTAVKSALEKAVGPVPPVAESSYAPDVNSRQDEDRNVGGEEYLQEQPRVMVAPPVKKQLGRPPKKEVVSEELVRKLIDDYLAKQKKPGKKKKQQDDDEEAEESEDDSEDL